MRASGDCIVRCRLASLVVATLVAASVAAADQVFYEWTDDRGVVHYADQPPPGVPEAKRRVLAVPPAVVRPAPVTEPGEPATEDAAVGGEERSGAPARVVLVSSQSPRLGPSRLQLTGEVKNTGETSARGVMVTVSVLDDTQQNPCLSTDVAVEPSALDPGQSGKFEAEVDDPCLFGTPTIRFEPSWD